MKNCLSPLENVRYKKLSVNSQGRKSRVTFKKCLECFFSVLNSFDIKTYLNKEIKKYYPLTS